MSRITVYLAGGFKSNWQDAVMSSCNDFIFKDPRLHNIQSPKDYTDWDLKAVEESDVIFAYMENSNPGGYALALEVGYAKALNKTIIFIEEELDRERNKRFDMVRACADYKVTSLTDGIGILLSLEK